jgi:hypothetical protein
VEEHRIRNAVGDGSSPSTSRNPITVTEVFAAAGLTPQGVIPWRGAVPEQRPGVYVVALVSDADGTAPEIDIGPTASAVSDVATIDPW